jgi:AcrR family transcriptional regulator
MMQKQSSSEMRRTSVLAPTTPVDIGEQSQRRRIVDAMIASCAEKSYAATTISDIVARARISRTTFYKRFADKRDCFDATVQTSVRELAEVVAAAASPADPPAEVVRKGTSALLAGLARKPELGQLLTADAIAVEPQIVGRYRRLVVPALESVWDDQVAKRRHLDPQLAFGRAQVLIFSKVTAGTTDRLTELLPELTYLGVAPFAGHEEALRQARLATGEMNPDGPVDSDG